MLLELWLLLVKLLSDEPIEAEYGPHVDPHG